MNYSLPIEQFCGSQFLDLEQAWGNSVSMPRLSDCFMVTVLIWVPTAALLLMAPYQCYLLVKSKRLPLPWSALLIVKLVLYVLTAGVVAISLAYAISGHSQQLKDTGQAEMLGRCLLLFSMLLLAILALCCRWQGLVTSAVISISLLLFAICGFPELFTRIHGLATDTLPEGRGAHSSSMIISYAYLVYYFCLILLLILNCFSDKRVDYEEITNQKQCPEYETSFFSQITYSWLNGLCFTGWRRPLTDEDMWSLNERDTSESLVKKWESHWIKRVQKYWSQHDACKQRIDRNGEDMHDQIMLQDGAKANVTFKRQATTTGSASRTKPPSIIYCLYLCIKSIFLYTTAMKLAADTLQFVNPVILQYLLQFISSDKEPLWKGYFYAAGLFIASLLYSVLTQYSMHGSMRIGMNIRTMLTSSIYKKVLNLSSSARLRYTAGEIVNLMSVDVQRFMDVTQFLNYVWSSPLTLALASYFLYLQLGPAVLGGLVVMALLVPFNYWLSIRQRRLQFEQMRLKDSRMKVINEIMNGIKVLKFYAWEESFEKQALEIRSNELRVLKSAAFYAAIANFSWTCSPVLVTVVSFACYVYLDPVNNILTPERAFVSLSLFNILRLPLMLMPMLVSFMVQASVSNKRLKEFLVAEEIEPDMVSRSTDQDEAVRIDNATFTWDKENGKHDLEDINMRIAPGQLVAVVGQVGAGKSSLIQAVLGEMEKVKGYVGTKGSVAYVPQQAWIQNLTLRDNITFSKTFDKTKYERVIDSCALKADVEILPGGDTTEIGEKGVNLSGGQKQRVSLARAVYQNADLYLFDDPLSAVDAHVGKHIFDRVISNDGLLKGKTRVLVTHGLGYLKNVDRIIVLRDGRISEVGTYKELLAQKGAFAELIENYLTQNVKGDEDEGPSEENDVVHEEVEESFRQRLGSNVSRRDSVSSGGMRPQDRNLAFLRVISQMSSCEIVDSDDAVSLGSIKVHRPSLPDEVKRASALFGTIDSNETPSSAKRRRGKKNSLVNNVEQEKDTKKEASTLIQKESSATGQVKWGVYKNYISAVGLWTSAWILLLFIVSNLFIIGSSVWLSDWSDDSTRNATVSVDARVGVYAALGVAQALFTLAGTLLMAYGMVSAGAYLHYRLLRNLLRSPMSFYDVTPMGRIINRIGKDIDIIDNVLQFNFRTWLTTLSSVAATLVIILIGLPVFGLVVLPLGIVYYLIQRFYIATSRQLKRLESISRSPLLSHFQETVGGSMVIRAYDAGRRFIEESQRRVDFNHRSYWPNLASNRWLGFRLDLIGNLIITAAALFAVLTKQWDATNSTAGMIGVAVSYAMSITMALNISVRMASEVESNVVAVERVKEYSETETEAEWHTDTKPPAGWPQGGVVKFDDYKLRYRPGLDLVIRGITCHVDGSEKVGIVGRTGAGKSSLTLALFRIVEAAGGRVLIDGQDISKMGLHDLRSHLTIIPQEPVLFSGTIRMNLDPFDSYSDEQVWNALEQAHLKEFVAQTPSKLTYPVSEGGENLSVGQRQLLCLARALLKKTKVLVLDEATAAVDLETDDLIQKTIRTQFRDCTILTIAHRLNTIMDSDRVMVLSKGEIVEFDNPQQLLQNDKSAFYSMAKEAGIV